MTVGQYDREAIHDHCACGRKKYASDYVCERCYASGRYHHAENNGGAPQVVVIDGKGELADGAQFDGTSFGFGRTAKRSTNMLSLGYCPEGMIVSWRGRKYMVCGAQMEPQRLEALGD